MERLGDKILAVVNGEDKKNNDLLVNALSNTGVDSVIKALDSMSLILRTLKEYGMEDVDAIRLALKTCDANKFDEVMKECAVLYANYLIKNGKFTLTK